MDIRLFQRRFGKVLPKMDTIVMMNLNIIMSLVTMIRDGYSSMIQKIPHIIQQTIT